jgi:FMN phosphatase YigB (HAD superfamily)
MQTTYSFDVFDTCLTRKFAAPSDLFLELGQRLLRRLPALSERFDAETLWAMRMEAERFARWSSTREEVTLDEIWREFSRKVDSPELLALSPLELELEDESLCPIACAFQEIEKLRVAGSRILFISDIYLPRSFVETQLQKHGFAHAGDEIYVSSEWGKTKATGNLFERVLKEEKLEPRHLFHRGDNAVSDVEMPRRLGIECQLVNYRRTTPVDASLLALESPDYNIRSKFVGAMQTSQSRQTPARSGEAVPLIAELLSPLVFAFASWVLSQARRDGIRRLYFLARDCQMTYRAAQELSGHFGNIECRYLHVSRQALLLPTSEAISEAGMPWMRRAYETPALERLLAKLELDYSDVQSDWEARARAARGKYQLKHDGDWQLFWDSLNREPLRRRLLARIDERRQSAQDYFQAQGLLGAVPWAVVDLGWYLSCQRALRTLLRGVNPAAECRGYYLGLRRERFSPAETGNAMALFHQRGADLPTGVRKQTLFQHATLFEHVLGMADHPSVHHYNGTGNEAQPVFQSSGDAVANIELTRAIQDRIRTFAAQNAALAPELGVAEVAAPLISELAENFAHHPSTEMARALSAVQASGDQNNLHASSLAAPLGLRELTALWLPKRLRKILCHTAMPTVWMEGRLAATSPMLRRFHSLRKTLACWMHPPNAAA